VGNIGSLWRRNERTPRKDKGNIKGGKRKEEATIEQEEIRDRDLSPIVYRFSSTIWKNCSGKQTAILEKKRTFSIRNWKNLDLNVICWL
jgi:hypothetical protein